jgi:hypothetical protein
MFGRAAVLFLFTVCVTRCAPCPETRRVSVKLFNDAIVSRKLLQSAASDAAWILKSACVEPVWIPCLPVTRSNMAPCAAPPMSLELHILPAPLTNVFSDDAMGVAMIRRESGDHAPVFVSRVRETAARNPELAGIKEIMGCVMAHEIGHLLLHSNSHSSEGVMRAEFRRTDLIRADQRRLIFTQEERAIIQRNLINQGADPNAASRYPIEP